MYPLEIHDDPAVGGRPRSLLVAESFSSNPDHSEHVVVYVATVDGIRGRQPQLGIGEDIQQWTAYSASFPATVDQATRIFHCRSRGNKLPEEVAKAIFPRLAEYPFRR